MLSIDVPAAPVKSMSDERAINVAARLKRDVAIHRAAQTLADAIACRAGETPRGLSVLPADDRDWFKATTKSLIDLYESMLGIEPIATTAPAPQGPAIPAVTNRALILRQQGRDSANERGHDMGTYRPYAEGIEWSVCKACGRSVLIDLSATPSISGSAINEGCLAAVTGKDVE